MLAAAATARSLFIRGPLWAPFAKLFGERTWKNSIVRDRPRLAEDSLTLTLLSCYGDEHLVQQRTTAFSPAWLAPAWPGWRAGRYSAPVDSGELFALVGPYAAAGGPGHAAGVYRGGALVAQATAGGAVIEHDVAIGPGTMFDIASRMLSPA